MRLELFEKKKSLSSCRVYHSKTFNSVSHKIAWLKKNKKKQPVKTLLPFRVNCISYSMFGCIAIYSKLYRCEVLQGKPVQRPRKTAVFLRMTDKHANLCLFPCLFSFPLGFA